MRRRAPDLVAIESREQSGLAGARNTGLTAARGQIVAFLDDDAIAAADWIERLAADYRDPRVVGVGGSVLPLWERGRPGWLPEEFQWVVGCSYRGLPRDLSPVRNLIGCNMSFRREVFDQVGGFTNRLGRVGARPLGCEETELCIRLGREVPDGVLLYDPEARVHHRVTAERTTWRYFLRRCHTVGAGAIVAAIGTGSSHREAPLTSVDIRRRAGSSNRWSTASRTSIRTPGSPICENFAEIYVAPLRS